MAKQTYEELLKQQEELAKKIEEARQTELATVIAQIKTDIDKYKLTAEDLGFSTSKTKGKTKTEKKDKVIKFMNPENHAETYSGHGRKPDWLVKKLAEGRQIEEFAV